MGLTQTTQTFDTALTGFLRLISKMPFNCISDESTISCRKTLHILGSFWSKYNLVPHAGHFTAKFVIILIPVVSL